MQLNVHLQLQVTTRHFGSSVGGGDYSLHSSIFHLEQVGQRLADGDQKEDGGDGIAVDRERLFSAQFELTCNGPRASCTTSVDIDFDAFIMDAVALCIGS